MLTPVHTIERQPKARSDATRGDAAPPPWPLVLGQSPLIAVIDDNADIVEAVSEALVERQYRVDGYRDAAVALSAMEQGEVPSLIVLDLMMPRMDGWTFRLKQRASPRLCDVPVIVMSASGSAQAEAIDADTYLRKPLSMERFCLAVEQTLARAERKRLLMHSAEIERLRTLGLLAASIAHEINNPLTYISGNLDLALRSCQGLLQARDPVAAVASLEKSLCSARIGTDHVADIVSGLLVFARSESDSEQTADLTRSLEGALRLSRAYAAPRATLHHEWSHLPPVVGQEARLGQVFLNLIMNAAQAIEPGAPASHSISITAVSDASTVTVEVADTGRGIAPQDLERVFDAFFTTKPVGEGTGIGLSFCKEVVERAGGSIRVRSTLGVGTSVFVQLRIAPS